MRPSITAVAAISALCHTVLGSRCDNKDGLCLTSFRWCDVSPCEFPDNVYPLHEDLGRNVGYAVLDERGSYTVSWTGARAEENVLVRWSFGTNSQTVATYPSVSWGKNTTDDHLVFRPIDAIDELFRRNETNLTFYELQGMAAEMTNTISIYQESGPGDRRGQEDTSSQFAVEGSWATRTMKSYAEVTRRAERRKWTLGVGIGVGLGVPILMALTALVTRAMTRKKMARTVPKGSP